MESGLPRAVAGRGRRLWIALLCGLAILCLVGGIAGALRVWRTISARAAVAPMPVTLTQLLSQPHTYDGQRVVLAAPLTRQPMNQPGCFFISFEDQSITNLPTNPPRVRCGASGAVLLPFFMCERPATCPGESCITVPPRTDSLRIVGTFAAETDEFGCPSWHLIAIDWQHIQAGVSATNTWQAIPESDILLPRRIIR